MRECDTSKIHKSIEYKMDYLFLRKHYWLKHRLFVLQLAFIQKFFKGGICHFF